jgi:hypothetical protein
MSAMQASILASNLSLFVGKVCSSEHLMIVILQPPNFFACAPSIACNAAHASSSLQATRTISTFL